jgi:hypothetical protein
MAGHFAVALLGVHVAHVDAGPGTLTGQIRIAPARTELVSMWPSVLCWSSSSWLIA